MSLKLKNLIQQFIKLQDLFIKVLNPSQDPYQLGGVKIETEKTFSLRIIQLKMDNY